MSMVESSFNSHKEYVVPTWIELGTSRIQAGLMHVRAQVAIQSPAHLIIRADLYLIVMNTYIYIKMS